VISRFSRRPTTTLPGRRRNHHAASPEKGRGHFGVLPRCVPAGCKRKCRFIGAQPQSCHGRESGDEDHGADHHRTCVATVEPATSSIMPSNQVTPAESAREFSFAGARMVRPFTGAGVPRLARVGSRIYGIQLSADTRQVVGLTFGEHIITITAPAHVGGPTGAKRMSIFRRMDPGWPCADDGRHRRHRPAR